MTEYVIASANDNDGEASRPWFPNLFNPQLVFVDETGKDNAQRPKRKYTKRKKEEGQADLIAEDDETKRNRDILASAALLDNIKDYIGEKIPSIQFRNVKKERLETLFKLYKQKSGQELAEDALSGIIGIGLKLSNFFGLELEEEEQLREELLDNRFLKRAVGCRAATVAEEYGDVVGILRAIVSIVGHTKILKDNDSGNNGNTSYSITEPSIAGTSGTEHNTEYVGSAGYTVH